MKYFQLEKSTVTILWSRITNNHKYQSVANIVCDICKWQHHFKLTIKFPSFCALSHFLVYWILASNDENITYSQILCQSKAIEIGKKKHKHVTQCSAKWIWYEVKTKYFFFHISDSMKTMKIERSHGKTMNLLTRNHIQLLLFRRKLSM